jgi:uncharacterized protein YndB with AHSA1/START domain
MTVTEEARTQDLVIERTFTDPPERIWSMWTDPDHFAAWYGPAGAAITVATMDVHVGGRRLIRMDVETPQGAMQMWFVGEYLDVAENRLLVYTDAMSDDQGNVLGHEQTGMPPGHPTTTEVRVQLEAVDGGTRMVLTHVGIATESPGAAGWQMAFEKLDAHLGS